MSNITKRKGKTIKKFNTKDIVKFPICISMLLCQQNVAFILGTSELATHAKSLIFYYQQQKMNYTQQHILFSHLHFCKRPVVVADVEQSKSLWKQPTKTEEKTLSTCIINAVKKIKNKKWIASNFQLVTEIRIVR